MMRSNYTRLLLFTVFLISACTGAKVVTDGTANSNALFPSWYQNSAFSADSSGFNGFATSISSDSLVALDRADRASRMQLEKHLAKQFEDVRTALVSNGEQVAAEAGFIVMLRNAHYQVESEATVLSLEAKKTEKGYRGFAKSSIDRMKVNQLMETGFKANSAYWKALSGSTSYQNMFTN